MPYFDMAPYRLLPLPMPRSILGVDSKNNPAALARWWIVKMEIA